MNEPMLDYMRCLTLPRAGDCFLLGVDPAGIIYAELIYGPDAALAQYALNPDGAILTAVDEDHDSQATPLTLPGGSVEPGPIRHSDALKFSGPRQRGLREAERIAEMVRPLSLATRMHLIERLGLDVMPPALLGVAERQVLAEAPLGPQAEQVIVCRRLRLAVALPAPRRATDGLPYDYVTLVVYAVHPYNAHTDDHELPPDRVLNGLPGAQLICPMDCLVHQQQLYVADGGGDDQPASIHIWRIATPN